MWALKWLIIFLMIAIMNKIEVNCTSTMGDKMTIEQGAKSSEVSVSVLEECLSKNPATITIGKYEAELIIEYLKAKFEI